MNKFSVNALPSASTSADMFENFINVAMIVGVIMFVATMAAMFLFLWKYKRRSENDVVPYIDGNYAVEFTGIFLISIWVAVFFLWGWRDYSYVITPKQDEYEINVIGTKWQWQIQYPNGKSFTNEAVIPVGRPVRFIITSSDVLHSFFIPEFRIKQDAVPGQFTTLHATPTVPGEYHIFCAEYCGTLHSKMIGTVHVLSKEDFQKWEDGLLEVKKAAGPKLEPSASRAMSMAESGKHIFRSKACVTCHSVGGERGIGPTVKGLFGAEVELQGGTLVKADENYIRESIMDPMKKIVKGYAPHMPTFRGMLSDEDVNHLIAYFKTLK